MISKRKLRFVQMTPLLAVCEYCNTQFSGSEEDVASAKIPIKMPLHIVGSAGCSIAKSPEQQSEKFRMSLLHL